MGATNHTTNYNLSQFIGTDKPAWLSDYNGDMAAIDTAIKNAATDAATASSTATAASGVASSAANTANTLNTQINTPVTGLAAMVTDQGSDIANLKSQNGADPLQTVSQTLSGAVNELNSDIGAIENTIDNTYIMTGTQTFTAAYNGTKTNGDLVTEIIADLKAWIIANPTLYYRRVRFACQNINYTTSYIDINNTWENCQYSVTYVGATDISVYVAALVEGSVGVRNYASGTVTDVTNVIASANATLTIEVYKKISL